jgi:rod shape-determining protein MreD
MSVLTAESRRDVEIRRYPVLVYALVPVGALVLQAWLPRVLGRFAWFDLPLVVTVFFALSRRNPIQGSVTGGILGLLEDGLTGHAIGINGVAKTLVGYLAASVGVLINVDAYPIRLLLTFVLSLVGSATYFFVYRFLLGLAVETSWLTELYKAIGNSVIALIIFPLLDRTKIRD